MSSSSSSSSGQPNLRWIEPFLESIPVDTEQAFTILGENCEGLEWVTSPAGTPQNGTGLSFTTKWADSGMARQVVAILGNVFLQAQVNVVKIGEFFTLEGGNVPPTLNVLRGQTIVFVVSIDPLGVGATWPVGKPVWSHGIPDPSPLWAALTYLKAQQVTFPISGETTVTVECGNTKSVIVKVGDLATRFAQGNLRPGVGASRTVTTTATIERLAGGDALTVNLSTNNPRATVSPASFVLAAGSTLKTQQVTVTGVTLSAADQDTTLLASVAGVTNGTASVTVVEPKRYDIARSAQSGAWTTHGTVLSMVEWRTTI